MGKKSTPAPPPAPDPNEIAQSDVDYNRIDQIGPFGSLTFSGENKNIATTTLPPWLQQLVETRGQSDQNLLEGAIERQGNLDSSPINLDGFNAIQQGFGDSSGINFNNFDPGQLQGLSMPQLQQFFGQANLQGSVDPGQVQGQLDLTGVGGIPQDIEAYRGDVESAFFDRQRALLDPVFEDQQKQLTSTLANRGLPQSGEAFQGATNRFQDARGRAFTDVARNATLVGGQEASRQLGDVLASQGQRFGQSLAGGQFANNATGQQFGQNLAAGQFGNQAAQQGYQNQFANTAFNNQTGLQNLAAQQGIRGQQFGEAATTQNFNDRTSAQNLGLQQQLLNNNNAGRAQGLAEQLGIRGSQLNEIMAMLGMSGTSQPSGFSDFYQPGQVNTTANFGLEANVNSQNYQAQLANQGSALSGLFGLGGAILGGPIGSALGGGIGGLFGGNNIAANIPGSPVSSVTQQALDRASSDRRLKRNIKRIGSKSGYPWYKFEYIWGEKSEGVMSDEIPQEFVHKDKFGFDTVDYGALLGAT